MDSLMAEALAGKLPSGQHRTLVAALRVPVVMTTLGGDVVAWNDAAQRLFGSALAVGQAVSKFLPFVATPISAGAFQDLHGVVPGAGAAEVEVTLLTLLANPLSADQEAVFVIHHTSHDLALGKMGEQLLYNVAHELRGPLSALQGALEVLDENWHDLPSQEVGSLVTSARRTSGRLRMLLEDLLSAGSIQAGRFAVATRSVPLQPILDDSLEAARPHLEAREQIVEVVGGARALKVLADPRYTRQVLVNLLMNASKYSPARGRINIIVSDDDGPSEEIRVTVEDRGQGISPQQLLGLFERFYRAGEQGGFGLGLAISRSIVEAQGGTMGVESHTGEGTRVWLTLQRPSPDE
jgi:signal transduction histidine kinase